MQPANVDDVALRQHVRRATQADAAAVFDLIQNGTYVHVHADWHAPGDWLGAPGFVVFEAGKVPSRRITSCLAVTADPAPAAWVRLAAVRSAASFDQFQAMMVAVIDGAGADIDEIAWFLIDYWPVRWLQRMGFVQVNEVVSYRKDDFRAPEAGNRDVEIRPVTQSDFAQLAALEAAAFEPRWRHSESALFLAWRQSYSFDVATQEGRPVGFQFSTRGRVGAHLARMTVLPEYQGRGIGAALLAHAVAAYRRDGLLPITLNTQTDNIPSQRLYERFGFTRTTDVYPVMAYFPGQGEHGTQKTE